MKKINFLSLIASSLLILLCLNSCKTEKINTLKDCQEHVLSDCGVELNKTNIRIKNVSKYDFCNFVLRSDFNYGIIKQATSTCYMPFDEAYRYDHVQLFIEGVEFIIQPIDFVGEKLLGQGNFTYAIDVEDFDARRLSIKATKD